jgi:hypothetical protein
MASADFYMQHAFGAEAKWRFPLVAVGQRRAVIF